MKNLKKIIAVILVILLNLSFFSIIACAEGHYSTPSVSSSDSTITAKVTYYDDSPCPRCGTVLPSQEGVGTVRYSSTYEAISLAKENAKDKWDKAYSAHNKTCKGKQCAKCGKYFSYASEYSSHYRTCNGCECTYCGTHFNSYNALEEHIKDCDALFPYKCIECGQKFPTESTLITHIETYHPASLYVCQECGQKFLAESELNMHIKALHRTTSYVCQECGQTFQYDSDLNNHYKKVHQINSENTVIHLIPTSSVDYRSTVIFTATASDVPSGCVLAIYEGKARKAKGNSKSVSYKMSELTSDKSLTVKVIDAKGIVQKDHDGNELVKNAKIIVKSGLLDIIIAFFKDIFGMLPTVEIKPRTN